MYNIGTNKKQAFMEYLKKTKEKYPTLDINT